MAYGDLIDSHLVPILAGFVISTHTTTIKILTLVWWAVDGYKKGALGGLPFPILVVDRLQILYGKGTYSHTQLSPHTFYE